MFKLASRLRQISQNTLKWQFVRFDSFDTSNSLKGFTSGMKGTYEFPESNANFETSTAEWEFVERLYPMKYIPKPNFEPGEIAPSGWRAPKAKKEDYPYFVTRDRSHLFRLYRDYHPITQKLKTKLKGIEGDVFALGEELKKYLLPLSGKRMIDLRVYEPYGIIIIRGDLKMLVLDFLHEKGF